MRIVIALITIIILGGILAAVYTFQPRAYNAAQVSQIKTSCPKCHTIPPFSSQTQAHNDHRFLECSVCHGNNTGGEIQEGNVKSSVCVRCHSVPPYSTAAQLHNDHSAADCSICHIDSAAVKSAADIHRGIRYAGLALLGLGLIGLLVNYVVVRVRMKRG